MEMGDWSSSWGSGLWRAGDVRRRSKQGVEVGSHSHFAGPGPGLGQRTHPAQPFCFLGPYLHRCGSQGDSGTGTLQTLELLCRVGRGNTISARWPPAFDNGKTLPT